MKVFWGEIKLRNDVVSKYYPDDFFRFNEKNFTNIASPVFGDGFSAVIWIYQELRRIAFLGGSIKEFGACSPLNYGYVINTTEIDDSFSNLLGGNPNRILEKTNGKYSLDMSFMMRQSFLNNNFGKLNDYGNPIGFETPFINAFSFGDSKFLKGGKRRIGLDEPLIRIKSAAEIDKIREEIKKTTEICIEKKRWTIPTGAVVDLRLEKFRYLELMEEDDSVIFIFRDENEYFSCSFDSVSEEWDMTNVNIGWDTEKSELTEKHRIAINYLCALVLHDFWVPDLRERKKAFITCKVPTTTLGRWAKPADDDRKVIKYLPRVLYVDGYLPVGLYESVYSGSSYHRKAHVRRLEGKKASTTQLLLATQYGIRIPKGYTFVKSTNIIETNQKEEIFISRSFFGKISKEDSTEVSSITIKWEKFENDVAQWLSELGFRVIPGKKSKRGDKGIDVTAFDNKNQMWIIQCKCWSRNRKVGPDVLREIWGAQKRLETQFENDNIKIRSAIITTSSFSGSEEFTTSAESLKTVLIDGDMFARREWPTYVN